MELTDGVEDDVYENRSQSHRRLIHQKNTRVGHQRASCGQHLLFTPAERASHLFLTFPKPGKKVKNSVKVGCDEALVFDGESAHFKIFSYGQAAEDPPALWNLNHSFGHYLMGPIAGEILSL